jgi:hypothetical protein
MTAIDLIATIARMTTESEADAAGTPMSGDDACAALSRLIEEARAVEGPVFLAIYIGCNNDVNGNPRRGWYVHDLRDPSAPVTWVEEGYHGQSAPVDAVARVLGMPTATWRDVAAVRALVRETGRINVTPGEYRDARKLPRFGGAE